MEETNAPKLEGEWRPNTYEEVENSYSFKHAVGIVYGRNELGLFEEEFMWVEQRDW
jgi:hypothetical protein